MFAFKIWGDFACFRDPLTISQTITFPIPPKTTIGGMMAGILGFEWSKWMDDESYFDFKYSVVVLNPIRKKSFMQNCINDYTKQSETKLNKLVEISNKSDEIAKLACQIDEYSRKETLNKKEQQKDNKAKKDIEKLQNDIQKKELELQSGLRPKDPQKQISRELLLNPEYLVVVDNYKYESAILELLINHESRFPFYLGNSEFLGNFEHIKSTFSKQKSIKLDSFTKQIENIDFMQIDRKYTNIKMATKVIEGRLYRDYENFVICNKDIVLKNEVETVTLKFDGKEYFCEMA